MAKYRIGIECEEIESKNPSWGVGKMLSRLLEEISKKKELEDQFKFILYFKDSIPDLPYLNSPVFEKKTTPVPFFPHRLFPIYYFALLPVRLWFEKLDAMYWPKYMLPVISLENSLVVLTEDVYYETFEGNLPFRYRLSYAIFSRWAAVFAKKIMVISETSKRNVSKLFKIDEKRISVNHLGIDVRENINFVQPTEKYILYVGQAFPRRHLKETMLAFEKIHGQFPDLKLIAVGPDKYDAKTIAQLAKDVNSRIGCEAISHANYVSDGELLKLYAGASSLIYVSDREAFGLPPMEALSFGVAPVVADNELGHELFEDYAFYAANNTVDGIAGAIVQSLTDSSRREKIKTDGPQFAGRYSWKRFADNWLNIIRSMVK
ncbi:MAG: Glycosyl transferase group 1 [Candidatus Yanofskybacteria bacterium GW2011_GWA2_44_10]|nr:MAG: Glycosyl transferase group 1 [Candidatus Yanofskybacteria bacterium GW2011_GWA2_44_10]